MDVKLYFEEYRKDPAILPAAFCAESHSQGHGHFEKRSCCICEDIGWLNGQEKWMDLQEIGVIFCECEIEEKIKTDSLFYLQLQGHDRRSNTGSKTQLLGD